MACKIIGCGGYLPKQVLTNNELQLSIDTSDEWIRARTGIKKRHIASATEHSSHLALEAAKLAIADSQIELNQLDLIIVATTTPDNSFPSTATHLHKSLGITRAIPAFDIQGVCCGFIYGLQVASSLIENRHYNKVLLVGAEKMSALLDWTDRSTCVLFGDGAGAVILSKGNPNSSSGVIDNLLYSDGNYYDLLYTDGGISSNMTTGKIKMQGPTLFRHAVEKMSDAASAILARNSLSINDIDYVVPHQANIRIIEAIADKLSVPHEKLVITVDEHANCSAASIPLALSTLRSKNMLVDGKLILCMAFGAGLTWGASLIRW